MRRGNWAEAVVVCSKGLELRKDQKITRTSGSILLKWRGEAYVRLGEWQKAAADLAWATKLRRDDSGLHFLLAASLLLSDDAGGYRRACAEALKLVAEGKNLDAAYIVVRACGLTPEAVPDPAVLINLMEQYVAESRQGHRLHTLGLAHYRARQYKEAIHRLEESRKVDPSWDQQTCVNGFVLALAHHRLGHVNEARGWLDKTVARLEQGTRERGLSPSFPAHIVDWLSCLILRREAEAEIGKPAAKPDGKK
jgi:Flp pilus assembly protein TadD